MQSRIHIAAPASPCADFLAASGLKSFDALMALIQESVGPNYTVSGDESLIVATEDDKLGGRTDDARRAADLTDALADDDVVAISTIRGGAWLTRILPLIDFNVLEKRSRPVALFGFSEITFLVNMVGSFPMGRGVYDNSPAFLTYGLRQWARKHATSAQPNGLAPRPWAKERLLPEFRMYYKNLVRLIEGRGSSLPIDAKLVRGTLADRDSARFIGGNLTVLSTIAHTPYLSVESPRGHWIVVEDYNDKLSRLDRMLSGLSLSGLLAECDGLLLGDFHREETDLGDGVLTCLKSHIPPIAPTPVLITRNVGHIWPMSPLPMHVDCTLTQTTDAGGYRISWPNEALQTVRPVAAADPS